MTCWHASDSLSCNNRKVLEVRYVICPSSDHRGRAGIRAKPKQEAQGPEPEPADVRVVPGAVCWCCTRPGWDLLLPHAGQIYRTKFSNLTQSSLILQPVISTSMSPSQPGFVSAEDAVHMLVKPSVDYVCRLKFPSGNYPPCIGDDRDLLVHWCHGSPGVIYMLLQAHKVKEGGSLHL